MDTLWNSFIKAIELIVSLDPEVMEIAGRSLRISITSTLIGSLIFVPVGCLIQLNEFRGKRFLVVGIIQTLYSVPTVAIGLFVFVFISRAGPLGFLNILFTPTAIIIGQVLLIAPVLLGLTISALRGIDKTIPDTARTLGASGMQLMVLVLKESRYAVMAAVILAFGRALSEVGISIMVGGNIRGFTRVLTTAISLESSKGDIEFSMALGIILLLIAVVANIIMNRIQQR